MTGPENDPSISLGGIVTVVNTILRNSQENITYFNRDIGEKNKVFHFIRKIAEFRKLIEAEKYHVLHFHFSLDKKSLLRELLYLKTAKRKNARIIIHLHGGALLFHLNHEKLVRTVLSTADGIIVLSELEKISLGNLYHIPLEKIIVLKNSIDLGEVPPFEGTQGGNNIVFFGRIHESKGIEDIVSACRLLTAKGIRFRFDAYGDGPLKDWFSAEMSAILQNNFNYHGIVWGKKKWEALEKADIFLLPSRYGEGLPVAMLEAMALGKAVVASNDASITQVVKQAENGLLIAKKAPEELAATIHYLLEHPELQQQLGENARKTIEQEYTSGQYMQQLAVIYAGIKQKHLYAVD